MNVSETNVTNEELDQAVLQLANRVVAQILREVTDWEVADILIDMAGEELDPKGLADLAHEVADMLRSSSVNGAYHD